MRHTAALLASVLACALGATAARGTSRDLSARAADGERLYLEGRLADGRPVEAVVLGDVPVTGTQLSCVTCHGRSGMGSVEGVRLAPPLRAPYLESPRRLKSRPRPPYTDAALVRAIRDGVDAAGNRLDPLMPRYRLGPAELRALVAYIRSLGGDFSPGADLDQMHLATILTPDADPAERAAMLDVLDAFIQARNRAAAAARVRHPPDWPEYYGEWVLHVWELQGPAAAWQEQLDAHFRSQPVFAVVSGLGRDEWHPIHRFCEAHRVPCLLPNLRTPPDAGADYYSLYFSGGTVLEAHAIAARLRDATAPQRVLQIFQDDTGARAARALADAVSAGGRDETRDIELADLHAYSIATLAREHDASAVVLWLDPDGLALLHDAPVAGEFAVFLSSTMLEGEVPAWLAGESAAATLAHPYALPAETRSRFPRVSAWLATRRVPPAAAAQRRIVDQTFFAVTMLGEGVMHLNKNFYRDYLLEVLDHSSGFETWSASYSRLSFGPGQRYLAKGCHLLPSHGVGPPAWVVP
ncbi:MAG: cytochrome c [Deltaproteobacteria bacterium]|nr:cytochrome c [Deltaproteobacteria bacterium]